MKKGLILVLLFALVLPVVSFFPVIKAATTTLIVNNREITYGDGTKVYINADYVNKDREFRAVWVSALTGDITGFSSIEQYKNQIIGVFETMEYYNLNVMLFHVRVMNDAFYKSDLNNWSTYYSTSPSWDALPWIIEECHKRGIEFHAWMNPYRVTTGVAKSLADIAKGFKGTNPASNPEYLLKGSSTVILNPGEPVVKKFLVDTCMELIENYDVDAIHFDDYFYCAGIDDSQTKAKYDGLNLTTGQWRRNQVSDFICTLKNEMKAFNEANNRRVQLGISPTGVYKNGNGLVSYDSLGFPITNGSATRGYAHYDNPLYADTLEWIKNEWIDYILPQTYHAITNSAAPYCDLVSWWDKVIKNTNVNLYVSIGLYMQGGSGNASWYNNKYEGYQQIMFANTMNNVKGISVYNYLSLFGSKNRKDSFAGAEDVWDRPLILPEVRTYDSLPIGKVSNLQVTSTSSGYKLSFDELDDAKFYCIYKSTNPITFDSSELLDVIGNVSEDKKVSYLDKNIDVKEKYYYAVKAQSYSLTLGEAQTVDTDNLESSDELHLGEITGLNTTDNVATLETVDVYWDKLYYPFGEEIVYSVSYNFGGEEYINKDVKLKNEKLYVQIKIPNDAEVLNVKILAKNDLGESVKEISKSISKSLPKIKSFVYTGKPYNRKEISFTWSNILLDNVKYTIESSTDRYTWIAELVIEESFTTPYITKEVRLGDSKTVYYRIKAEKDNSFTYSDYLTLNLNSYLGDIDDFTLNGEKLQNGENVFHFNEGEKIVLKWKRLSTNSVYSVMISEDLKLWYNSRLYDRSSFQEEEDGYITQTLTVTGYPFSFYIKITGADNNARTETEYYKVYAKTEYLYFDEVFDYILRENTVFSDMIYN